MTENDNESQIKALTERLDKLKNSKAEQTLADDHYNQAHMAWRMVIELVAGLVIGFGIGWGLDFVFNTRPIFLVLFIILGMAGGVNVMLRTAKEIGINQGLKNNSTKQRNDDVDN
jgi:ATP synthase protein I